MTLDLAALTGALGIAGVAGYLLSYGLLQSGVLRATGYAYPVLNLVAAALVLASLATAFNLAAAVIQVAWILISLVGILRIHLMRRRVAFSDEELDMIADALPDMPRHDARALLNAGLWSDLPAGALLTVEGAPVTHLHYVASGRAEVRAADHPVADLARGLVGEINVMRAAPASATARMVQAGRVFTVPGDALRRLAARDADFQLHLAHGLSRATGRKLVEANRALAAAGGTAT